MVDWTELEEANSAIKDFSRVLQASLSEANELNLLNRVKSDRSTQLSKKDRTFLKHLPTLERVRNGRFLLECRLQEKSSPRLLSECLVHQVFTRCCYNAGLPKSAFLADVVAILDESPAPCCLSVYRAMREIGLRRPFVPPAGSVADAVLAEEEGLHSLMREIVQFESFWHRVEER